MKLLLVNPAAEPVVVHLVLDDQVSSATIADRRMVSAKLLRLIDRLLEDARLRAEDLDGIGVVTGPGTFTSLRIAVAVANALAVADHLPLVPVTADRVGTAADWAALTTTRLQRGQTERLILPHYGREPTITPPKS